MGKSVGGEGGSDRRNLLWLVNTANYDMNVHPFVTKSSLENLRGGATFGDFMPQPYPGTAAAPDPQNTDIGSRIGVMRNEVLLVFTRQ